MDRLAGFSNGEVRALAILIIAGESGLTAQRLAQHLGNFFCEPNRSDISALIDALSRNLIAVGLTGLLRRDRDEVMSVRR